MSNYNYSYKTILKSARYYTFRGISMIARRMRSPAFYVPVYYICTYNMYLQGKYNTSVQKIQNPKITNTSIIPTVYTNLVWARI